MPVLKETARMAVRELFESSIKNACRDNHHIQESCYGSAGEVGRWD